MVLRGQCNGAKSDTEAADVELDVSSVHMVGERRACIEAISVSGRGACPSENAGMSSERGVRNPSAESLRVPGQG